MMHAEMYCIFIFHTFICIIYFILIFFSFYSHSHHIFVEVLEVTMW